MYLISLLIFLAILFYILFIINKVVKADIIKFINIFSAILFIIILFNFSISNKFFFKNHILERYIPFDKVEKIPDRRVVFLIFDELDQNVFESSFWILISIVSTTIIVSSFVGLEAYQKIDWFQSLYLKLASLDFFSFV